MKFAVFTHVEHSVAGNKIFAYLPYVREMNFWFNSVQDVYVTAPTKNKFSIIDEPYERSDVKLLPLNSLNFTSFQESLKSIFNLPVNFYRIMKLMYVSDHLHIRCPGNIGLLASIAQTFFPRKKKSFKYAGNWDSDIKQPWSYKLQKRILRNKFLTRNAKVLVYGRWQDQNENIVSFFTSSFYSTDIKDYNKNFSPPYRFIFVGSLVEGKRPITALSIIDSLKKKGFDVRLDIYGDGILKEEIKTFIRTKDLENVVTLHGNQGAVEIRAAYLHAHFSILPSKSEGWPKALAEAMFFGCVPIGTAISCVPWMLGEGKRGIIIEPDIMSATEKISETFFTPEELINISKRAQEWSQNYTLEFFNTEIKKFL